LPLFLYELINASILITVLYLANWFLQQQLTMHNSTLPHLAPSSRAQTSL